MRYTVLIEPTHEPDQPGWFYAHVPTLDLTTHGEGIEGARRAAEELVTEWIAQLQADGKPVPLEQGAFVSQIEVVENALHSA